MSSSTTSPSYSKLKKMASLSLGEEGLSPSPSPPSSPSSAGSAASSNKSSSSFSSQKMSSFATSLFSEISPHLPLDRSPRILQLVSEAFANAQGRIARAESGRDNALIRLRREEGRVRSVEKVMEERERGYERSLREVRGQRDAAVRDLERARNELTDARVKRNVMDAVGEINGGGGGGVGSSDIWGQGDPSLLNNPPHNNNNNNNNNNNSSKMRGLLTREFEERKLLLEQRWDHALELVTAQMAKQRDEQVALAVSKFDVEQRLKFQAEIARGLERVEAAARREVGDLTKLALKMHATVEAMQEKNQRLKDENEELRRRAEIGGKMETAMSEKVAAQVADGELERERLRQKVISGNVLIEELQGQVEEWKARSDGDWFRTRIGGGKNQVKQVKVPGSAARKALELVKEEERERNRRKDMVEMANSNPGYFDKANANDYTNANFIRYSAVDGNSNNKNDNDNNNNRNRNENNIANNNETNVSEITNVPSMTINNISDVAVKPTGNGDDNSINSFTSASLLSEPLNRRELSSFAVFGDNSGGGAAKVELSNHQPSALREHVNHPRLDALLQSF